MKVDVYNSKGSKTDKSVTLNKAVFGIEPNDHAIYLDVKRFQAARARARTIPCTVDWSPAQPES